MGRNKLQFATGHASLCNATVIEPILFKAQGLKHANPLTGREVRKKFPNKNWLGCWKLRYFGLSMITISMFLENCLFLLFIFVVSLTLMLINIKLVDVFRIYADYHLVFLLSDHLLRWPIEYFLGLLQASMASKADSSIKPRGAKFFHTVSIWAREINYIFMFNGPLNLCSSFNNHMFFSSSGRF